MKANVQQNTIGAKLPAGIMKGTEAFWYNNEKWVIHEGKVFTYNEAPTHVKAMIQRAFINDKKSQQIMKKFNITGINVGFDTWYHCVIGALDETPDFIDGNLNADAYNHFCTDYSCPMRGKLCSLSTGLLNYEVETLHALEKGETIEKTAQRLYISTAGLKSRIEKLKEKLVAKNMAELIAKASKIGI